MKNGMQPHHSLRAQGMDTVEAFVTKNGDEYISRFLQVGTVGSCSHKYIKALKAC